MECRLGINAGEVYLIIHFSWVLELLLIDTNDGFPCKLSPEFPTSYQEQIGALNLVWLNIIKVLMEVLRDE